MAEFSPPAEGIVLAHFIVSDDVERSRRFYTEVLGGTVAFSGEVTYVALANSYIIINVGGGPTDDKPTVTLETPRDPDRVSSFLNIRVKDIHAVYTEWSARGAQFLTPPKQHKYEIRCYIRDPDGYIIEVGQTTDPEGDWSFWLPTASAVLKSGQRKTSLRSLAGLGSNVTFGEREPESADVVPEREAQSRAGRLHLRDAVLEATLCLTAGHEEVASAQLEGAGGTSSPRSEQEFPGLSQGHQSNHGVLDLARYPIAMPSHAVSAVSVEVDPHGVELDAVLRRQGRPSVFQPLGRGDFSLIELLPGGEPRFVDLAVVHPTPTLAPGDITEQLLKSQVRAREPNLAVVHPGVPVQSGSLEAGE